MSSLREICSGLPLDPLPQNRGRDPSIPHAPVRTPNLTAEEERLALKNALRYFPSSHHATLAPEFAQELREYGHIYMYRFCPTLRMNPHSNSTDKSKERRRRHRVQGLLPETKQLLNSTSKKKGKSKTVEEEPRAESSQPVTIHLNFKRYVFDPHKKMVQS
ncbi:urocanate hydratase-like [Boleophthalmus pectinirostris]|uniref:urocanate hydratase-like n=1 Tax=Boleophthalmus pectinirostris TaxID=150288 RepID=UPI00242B5530|nr:urocanate hydratase-like [Boleophthalmus pectinirostris]